MGERGSPGFELQLTPAEAAAGDSLAELDGRKNGREGARMHTGNGEIVRAYE